MSTNIYNITPEQIIKHREGRKRSGMVGCISGRPPPPLQFFGYSDVQSWRPADPMAPHCFCFDCRSLWDSDAKIDTELVNSGNERACLVYDSLLPIRAAPSSSPVISPLNAVMPSPPMFTEPKHTNTIRPPVDIPRIEIPVVPDHGFSMSLPAPRHRDIMNESRDTRIKKDLLELIGDFQNELITVMDSRRRSIFMKNEEEREAYLADVDEKEADLWNKMRAAETLISALDE